MCSKINTLIALMVLPALVYSQEPGARTIHSGRPAQPPQLNRIYENNKVHAEYRYDGRKRLKTAIYYLVDDSSHPCDTAIWVCAYGSTGRVGAAGCITNRKKGLFKYYYTPDGKLDCIKGSDSFSVGYTYDKTGRVASEKICSVNGKNGRLQLLDYRYDSKNNIISMTRQYYAFQTENPEYKVYCYTKRYSFQYDRSPNPQPPIPSWFLYNFLDVPGNWYSAHNLTGLTWEYQDGNNQQHALSFHYVYDLNGYPLKAVVQTKDSHTPGTTYYFEYLQ